MELLAVIGSILAPIAAVATLYVNRLREQDKLQFDSAMKSLYEAVSRCETDCKVTRDSLTSERQRRETAEMATARLEGQVKSYERENLELRDTNRELREKLFGGK